MINTSNSGHLCMNRHISSPHKVLFDTFQREQNSIKLKSFSSNISTSLGDPLPLTIKN